MEVFSGFNQEYALSPQERSRIFGDVLELKKSSRSVLNSYEFLQHLVALMRAKTVKSSPSGAKKTKNRLEVFESNVYQKFWGPLALGNSRKKQKNAAFVITR